MSIILASAAFSVSSISLASHLSEESPSESSSASLSKPVASPFDLGRSSSSSLSGNDIDHHHHHHRTKSRASQSTNKASKGTPTVPETDLAGRSAQSAAETKPAKSPKSTDLAAPLKKKYLMPLLATKSAQIVLAPSLESIAMRVISSAASSASRNNQNHIGRSIGAAAQPSSSSSSSPGKSHHLAGDQAPQSLLASLSSTILSTALTQLASLNTSNLLSPISAPSTSSLSSWPNKLSPLLYSLASLTGLNTEDSSLASSSAPSSSFLTTDLSTSSSYNQPTLYTGSASSTAIKPHSSKQYSPTVLGIVNLARYVLCK